MKNFFVILLFLISGNILFSQPNAPIQMLRYNDNFINLRTDTIRTGFEKIKMINLGKNTWLSFGGEIREQFQYFDNQNFGDVPPTFKEVSTGQLWHRAMAHANLEFGQKVRFFTQINNTNRFFNPNPLTPEIDENRLSLHQAFGDFNLNKTLSLRIGRQELAYGNNRLLTFREGPNSRMSFDGAILKWKKGKWSLDALAISHVFGQAGINDDKTFKDLISGIYATQVAIPNKLHLDYYVLDFRSDLRKYNGVGGKEARQSFGFRAFSKQPKFNYEVEATYQIGKFNDLKINAYALAADLNYRFSLKKPLTVGVAANYISGDAQKSDNQLNTYNLLYSKPSFGLAAPIGASNIVNVNPYIRYNPMPKLSLLGSVYVLSRQSLADGTYSPGMAQVRNNGEKLAQNDARKIGNQYAFEAMYMHNSHWAFFADFAYFQAGKYPTATGKGLDISYFSTKISYKF